MELNIILHYDSNIKTFINNLNLPDELISKINLNIFIIYTDNSIVQDINSNFNINYYNLLNVNDILKYINSENILHITNNNIIICPSFYYSIIDFCFIDNTYYVIPLLIYNSDSDSDSDSLYIIKNNKLELCNNNIKYELSNDITGLLYDNTELLESNNNIQINNQVILLTKKSWEYIGFHSIYKNIIYKCILNSFEQFIFPLKCSNILVSNKISDIVIETPNINNYIPYTIKYTTERKIFKGSRSKTNNIPPKIVQKNTNTNNDSTSKSYSNIKNNIKNIIKQKELILKELYDLILEDSNNTSEQVKKFENYFNSI